MADHFVCRCHSYRFPHEIQAGKCNGSGWLFNYHALVHDECGTCDHHGTSTQLCSDCWCGLEQAKRPQLMECPAAIAEAKQQGVKLK